MPNFCISIFLALLLSVRLASGDDLAISIPIQLTHAQNLDPSPSPDGKKLVFISVISGKEQLFTMDGDGKNISQLTRAMIADHSMPTTRNDIVPELDWLNQSSLNTHSPLPSVPLCSGKMLPTEKIRQRPCGIVPPDGEENPNPLGPASRLDSLNQSSFDEPGHIKTHCSSDLSRLVACAC